VEEKKERRTGVDQRRGTLAQGHDVAAMATKADEAGESRRHSAERSASRESGRDTDEKGHYALDGGVLGLAADDLRRGADPAM
jgi:hypothetical protein